MTMCSASGLKHTEWTSEQDKILIDFLKSHECLYNVQCKDYRKTQLKQNLWKEIAQILEITDNDCSKRWGYVRDYYIKRRGKPSTGSSGEAAKKRSEQLSFLDSISSGKRSTLCSIAQSESQQSVENSTSFCNNEGNNIEQQSELLITADETSNDMADIQDAKAEIVKTPRVTKRKCITTSTSSDERLKIFFASMAKISKRLSKVVQARLRMQIGNLVGNAEIEHLSLLASPSYGNGPSSAGSSTSNSTFVTDDFVTPMGPSATLVMEEPSQNCFINM